MFDTGSSTGEIMGHSKIINAVSIRAQRPFKAVTAGDDATIVFHSGVPFKHEKVRISVLHPVSARCLMIPLF